MQFFPVAAEEHQRCANMPAQGNALGLEKKIGQALKGRKKREPVVPPLQGLPIALQTQGVALGWLVSGLWPSSRSFGESA